MFPELYSRFSLVILYVVSRVYICQSQFIPPSPFPLWCPCLCSLLLCVFLFCRSDHLYHFSRFHVYTLIHDTCFSLSGLLHSFITISRSIHVSTNDPVSFLFMANSIVDTHTHIYYLFFIHSTVGEHLGYFLVLAIVSSAAVNIGIHQSFFFI